MTLREPEWTEQDQADILALAEYRESMCPCGCGHPAADTTSQEEGGPQFTAERTVCRARLALVEAQEAVKPTSEASRARAAARMWSIRRHDPEG